MDASKSLLTIHANIKKACDRSGRNESDIVLIGASKYQPLETIRRFAEAGLCDFGENYEQELNQKRLEINHIDPGLARQMRWHFIGTLQRRKIRKLITEVVCIHSLDRLELADELEKQAAKHNTTMRALIQINLGDESTKGGLRADELESFLNSCKSLEQVQIVGLMALPPYYEDPEVVRPQFRRLRELRDAINQQAVYKEPLTELSMGMSHDYTVAIEEGATIIRIGTALFGERV